MKKVMLTGDRPSGCLHLGHYVGSLQNRVKAQREYDCFVMVADTQALSDNFDHPEKVRQSIVEVVKDYISVGIDPEITTIFVQSRISALPELMMYYLNLVTVSRLERNPTVKAEMKQKGFESNIPAGFLCYPVSQAADITAFRADVVPVGEDQLPLIEQTNEIVRKFNRTYGSEILKECNALLSSSPRLVGVEGKAKASKSLGNAIFLSDSKEIVKQKVFSMYTDPDHIKISDPGKVEGNVVFTYLDAFYANKEELLGLKDHYRRGGLGDTTLKNLLTDSLEELLGPIREKRLRVSDLDVIDILEAGSNKAGGVAAETLADVRTAMMLF